MNGSYLVLVDADRIHDYVFAPQRLKLIRGGSAIQDNLNRRLLPEELLKTGNGNIEAGTFKILDHPTLDSGLMPPWEAVYAGGGTMLALFRDGQQAKEYAGTASRLFQERTAGATATAAVVPSGGDFKEAYQAARRKLEMNKTARSEHYFASGAPYWKVCDSCGRFPAARRRRDPGGGERYPCKACELRLGASQETTPYLTAVNAKAGRGLKAADDFQAIARGSAPENYLALVYLDVNRLGRFLSENHSGSPGEFRPYSRALHDTVFEGVTGSCAKLCADLNDEDAAPFEILLIGGDDAIVMLRAQDVFRFLGAFRETFRDEPLLKDLDFSAAVVWAHHHFPIAQYMRRAEALLKSAKNRRGGGFAVDYEIVSEAQAGEIERRDEMRTKKPYALDDFLRLEETLKAWKAADMPANKVHELYEVSFESEYQARLDYYFLLSRLDPTQQGLAKKEFPDGRPAGAADLAELWDFVRAR